MNYSDEELVVKVLDGEKHFYGLLVDRYQRPVFNLMLRYVGNREEATDLTQDAFVTAFDKLTLFQTDKVFFPWLYKLAVNLAGDWSRKKTRHFAKLHILQHEMVLAQDDKDDKDEHTRLENREELDQLQDALLELPVQTREILILRYRHGCPVQDVAGAFNLSESAVKMRIQRGLRQLRSILSEDQGAQP